MPATVPLNDLARAAARERDELAAVITRVLDRGWFLQGEELAGFERELADYVGVAHAVGVASGTDALELALRAGGCGAGDHVLMAANAGYYAAAATARIGAVPVYADVDPETMSLTAATVAPALDGVAYVVVTHLYGRLADIEPIAALCSHAGATLIEDCAQAIGARRGRHAGTFGAAGAFSFYPTKNLGAVGDAGAVVTCDAATAERLRRLRQYGWEQKYVVADVGGVNSRLDEIQAAVLRLRLQSLDRANARRREIAVRYAAALSGAVGRLPHADDASYVAHLAVAVCQDRDALAAALARCGVETAIHYPVPDHLQPAYRGPAIALPVTEGLASRVLTLPCFPELTDEEVGTVCAALRDVEVEAS